MYLILWIRSYLKTIKFLLFFKLEAKVSVIFDRQRLANKRNKSQPVMICICESHLIEFHVLLNERVL